MLQDANLRHGASFLTRSVLRSVVSAAVCVWCTAVWGQSYRLLHVLFFFFCLHARFVLFLLFTCTFCPFSFVYMHVLSFFFCLYVLLIVRCVFVLFLCLCICVLSCVRVCAFVCACVRARARARVCVGVCG